MALPFRALTLWCAAACAAGLRPLRAVRGRRVGGRVRCVRIDGLVEEAAVEGLARTQEAVKCLRACGAVTDPALVAAGGTVTSQYGDPLATGPEAVARVGTFFARVVDGASLGAADVSVASLSSPSLSPSSPGEAACVVNVSQPWRIAAGVVSLAGESRVALTAGGLVANVELRVSRLNDAHRPAAWPAARRELRNHVAEITFAFGALLLQLAVLVHIARARPPRRARGRAPHALAGRTTGGAATALRRQLPCARTRTRER